MKRHTILKCEKCGFSAETLVPCGCGDCVMDCCGTPMRELVEKTAEMKTEKHVPYPVNTEYGMKVVVGHAAAHPMLPEHHIEWIEVINGDRVCRRFLKPDGAPEAEFPAKLEKGMIIREYCNIHGLWKYEVV